MALNTIPPIKVEQTIFLSQWFIIWKQFILYLLQNMVFLFLLSHSSILKKRYQHLISDHIQEHPADHAQDQGQEEGHTKGQDQGHIGGNVFMNCHNLN